MHERQVNRTTIGPAIFRAAHQILDADPKILNDPVAMGLVEGASVADIRAQTAEFQQPYDLPGVWCPAGSKMLNVSHLEIRNDNLSEETQP
jgi:hypothetical protein